MAAVTYCFFFFQAEDGIRDLYVTGVQTCALPISSGDSARSSSSARQRLTSPPRQNSRKPGPTRTHSPRSEERRVGKECRSRWSPYHSKKKRRYQNRLTRAQMVAQAFFVMTCM